MIEAMAAGFVRELLRAILGLAIILGIILFLHWTNRDN
jgi:hypothetical protein